MTDDQHPAPLSTDPELVHVLVTGNCGHTFPVPAARMNGSEFACPVCGEIDHLDGEALAAARRELELMRAKGPLDELGTIVDDHLSRTEKEKNESGAD